MRVGIVGVGVIGQALARAMDRGEVAAPLTVLHSRNLEKTRAFAHTLGRVPEVVGDIAGVITRCDLPNAAELATCNSFMVNPASCWTISPISATELNGELIASVS